MNSRDRPRFDPQTLRDLAGDQVFARGESYARRGAVEILSLDRDRVLSVVTGSEDYRTVVSGQDGTIGGECSCPAFLDRGFCKHMVAVAMVANEAEIHGLTDGADTGSRIRQHLREKGTDALVEMVMEFAERDPVAYRRLEMATVALEGDDKSVEKHLRKAINTATRTAGFIDYESAGGWAAGVETALDALSELASGPRAGIVIGLAEHAATRIENAIEDIDDSDGHINWLLARVQTLHLEACQAARPDPVTLAGTLFTKGMASDYGVFGDAAASYEDVLAEEGLNEYRRLAEAAWKKLPPANARGGRGREFGGDRYRLTAILDFFAERDGDVDARIALRVSDLSSPWTYLQLAQFCQKHDREADALGFAEEGLWLFEDDLPDERLLLFTVDLLVRADRKPDAEAHLWRAFGKAPSLDLYRRLRKLGGKPVVDRIVEMLHALLAAEPSTPWTSPADLLIRILSEEKRFDAAWATVREHGGTLGAREALAKASEKTHPQEAIEAYAERVEGLVGGGGNPAYQEAAELVQRMAALRDSGEQADYVAGLKERFGRRRNFMKLLV